MLGEYITITSRKRKTSCPGPADAARIGKEYGTDGDAGEQLMSEMGLAQEADRADETEEADASAGTGSRAGAAARGRPIARRQSEERPQAAGALKYKSKREIRG